MSKLSYGRIKEIINNGEGVIHDGAVYTRVEDLPPASKFVHTQEDKDTSLADLRAHAEEANRRLAELEAAQVPQADADIQPADAPQSPKRGRGKAAPDAPGAPEAPEAGSEPIS